MTLDDFFSLLSYGDLSNTSAGSDGEGYINENQVRKILSYTNQGLTQLYTRFVHKQDYVKIQLQEGLHEYPLRVEHAISNQSDPQSFTRFIQDSAGDPFLGGVIRVLTVHSEPLKVDEVRCELKLNDSTSEAAFRLPEHDVIYVKEPEADRILTVDYQQDHPRLTMEGDYTNQRIKLAPYLIEALECAVAARVFKSMGGEMNLITAQGLEKRYETICARAENKDMLSDSRSDEHDKMSLGGWP